MTWPTLRAFSFSPSHTPLDLHHLIKTYDRVLFFLHQNDPCLHWTWIQTETKDSFTVGRQHNAFLQGGRIFSLPRDVFLRSWDHLMGRAQCRTVWPNHIHWGVILVWLKASLFLFNHFVSATASTYLDEDKTPGLQLREGRVRGRWGNTHTTTCFFCGKFHILFVVDYSRSQPGPVASLAFLQAQGHGQGQHAEMIVHRKSMPNLLCNRQKTRAYSGQRNSLVPQQFVETKTELKVCLFIGKSSELMITVLWYYNVYPEYAANVC